jgi:leader peptidase (prepilin peptidase) / N-methyltransferase
MAQAFSLFSYILIFVLLFSLAWRDYKEYILPDILNAALAITFLSFHITTGWQLLSPQEAFLGAIMGGGLLLLIRYLANRFYREDALGLGDVKLMAAAGLGLGHQEIFLAMSLGAFVGLLHGVGMAVAEMRRNKTEFSFGHVNVPAGVGLAIGIALTMVYQFGFEWLHQP